MDFVSFVGNIYFVVLFLYTLFFDILFFSILPAIIVFIVSAVMGNKKNKKAKKKILIWVFVISFLLELAIFTLLGAHFISGP